MCFAARLTSQALRAATQEEAVPPLFLWHTAIRLGDGLVLLFHGYVRVAGRRRVLQLASSDADVPLERASHPSRRGASSEDVEELQEEVVVRGAGGKARRAVFWRRSFA